MEKSVKGYDQGKRSAEKFIAMIDKYQDFDTMTTTMSLSCWLTWASWTVRMNAARSVLA